MFVHTWPRRQHLVLPQAVTMKLETLVLKSLYAEELQCPFTETKRLKPVPVWQWHNAWQYTKWAAWSHGLPELVWMNWNGLHRAFSSTQMNTFGMSWNSDCTTDLLPWHQCLTSLKLMWLHEHKSLQPRCILLIITGMFNKHMWVLWSGVPKLFFFFNIVCFQYHVKNTERCTVCDYCDYFKLVQHSIKFYLSTKNPFFTPLILFFFI